MKLKILISAVIGICLIFSLCSCTKTTKSNSANKSMQDIEVTTKVGVSAEELGMKLPTSVNVEMKFSDDNNSNQSSTGKITVTAHFNETRKYNAEIQLLDLNNVPVSTESFRMDGIDNTEGNYTVDMHVDKTTAKRITKAKLVVGPVF